MEWPLLAKGLAGLHEAATRDLGPDGQGPRARHVPHRAASTTARVDPASVAARACFLCPENRPPQQDGLAWGTDFTLLCNPFPVVARHLTVVHRRHVPQRIEGRIETLLDLAASLPGFFALYNGPRCGASAPDHLHFQAGALAELPVVDLVSGEAGPAVDAWGARALLFRGARGDDVVAETERALALLASAAAQEPEPWCNVVAWSEPAGGFTLVLFPRFKHRPDAFHRGELTVSPAAIDLSGLLVMPVGSDFARITREEVRGVFREVTLPEATYREVVGGLRPS